MFLESYQLVHVWRQHSRAPFGRLLQAQRRVCSRSKDSPIEQVTCQHTVVGEFPTNLKIFPGNIVQHTVDEIQLELDGGLLILVFIHPNWCELGLVQQLVQNMHSALAGLQALVVLQGCVHSILLQGNSDPSHILHCQTCLRPSFIFLTRSNSFDSCKSSKAATAAAAAALLAVAVMAVAVAVAAAVVVVV